MYKKRKSKSKIAKISPKKIKGFKFETKEAVSKITSGKRVAVVTAPIILELVFTASFDEHVGEMISW